MFWKKNEPELPNKYIEYKLIIIGEEDYELHYELRDMLRDLAYFLWELVSVVETSRTIHTKTADGKPDSYVYNERHYYFKRNAVPTRDHPDKRSDSYDNLDMYKEELKKRRKGWVFGKT